MLIAILALAGFAIGCILPTRWGVFGFVGAAFLVFAVQVAVNFFTGVSGASLEESLALFNGSWASYFGFNLQITYRAFAPVLLALAVPFIFRLSR